MSPIEFILAIFRFRRELAPQIAILVTAAVILTYHITTNPIFDWLSK
jgi:hypothetical protein